MTVGPVTRDAATAEFFDAAAAGQFLLRYCPACGAISAPQATQCERCAATALDWRAARGDATLVSWTVAHHRAGGGEALDVLCIAQLAEGPWWWTRLEGARLGDIRPGLPLRIEYRRHSPDSEAVPVFVPAATR
jgi:uncharacterized protein